MNGILIVVGVLLRQGLFAIDFNTILSQRCRKHDTLIFLRKIRSAVLSSRLKILLSTILLFGTLLLLMSMILVVLFGVRHSAVILVRIFIDDSYASCLRAFNLITEHGELLVAI